MTKLNHEKSEGSYAQNSLHKWETYIDAAIAKWIGDGNMSSHPKAGESLDLGEDQYTPEDMRIAYKLMQENNAVPAWMALGFTLRNKHSKIIRKVQQNARDFLSRKREALSSGSILRLQEIEKRWDEAQIRLRDEITKYNSELLDYNLQVPSVMDQMIPLNAHILIEQALRQAESNS